MWSISNIDNTVKLSKKQALELSKISKYMSIVGDYFQEPNFANDEELLTEMFEKAGKDKFYLMFISDHMEHMDYIPKISESLTQLKIKGDITFGSMDGDNAGEFWGYRFDGKGGMKNLVGSVSFTEA